MSEEAVPLTREQKLQRAYEIRQQEVEDYQINIDNYELAIEVIDALPEEDRTAQSAYRQELVARLAAEKHQQGRAKIMLEVLAKQVAPQNPST